MDAPELRRLINRIEAEARKGDISLDLPVYAAAGRDAFRPVLFAGSLSASLAVMGRDLGAKEVKHGEPLIGDAGRRVRSAIYEAATGATPPPSDIHLPLAMAHVLLTNTVPYKPIGNKAYPVSVKERFRPFIEELLVFHWRGDRIITLGTEAFKWYSPYAESGGAEAFWARKDRYEADFTCELRATRDGVVHVKAVTVGPLPHPSPLNRAHWAAFPDMLKRRLERIGLPSAIP
jgi:uracil-DNA glycosylase